MNTSFVHPGQRVITTQGVVRVVAFIKGAQVFVYSLRGVPEPATVRYDALGGEAGSGVEDARRELVAA